MASVQEICQRLRGQRIETLRSRIEPLLAGRAGAEVDLFDGRDGALALALALAVARAVVGFADQQLGELDRPQAT